VEVPVLVLKRLGQAPAHARPPDLDQPVGAAPADDPVGTDQDAQDIVQEAYIRALKGFKRFGFRHGNVPTKPGPAASADGTS
jgi:hypothetical protein